MVLAFLIYEKSIKMQSYYDLRDTYTYTKIPRFRENDNVKIATMSLKPSRSPSLQGRASLTGGMPIKQGFGRLQQVLRGLESIWENIKVGQWRKVWEEIHLWGTQEEGCDGWNFPCYR